MGWYYNYRPYVSVAQRRQKAQREMEKRRKQGQAGLASRHRRPHHRPDLLGQSMV